MKLRTTVLPCNTYDLINRNSAALLRTALSVRLPLQPHLQDMAPVRGRQASNLSQTAQSVLSGRSERERLAEMPGKSNMGSSHITFFSEVDM